MAEGVAKTEKRDLDKVLSNIQSQYDKIRDFSAHFKQIFHHKILKRKEESEGNVKFKKPGFMRWNYLKPSNKSFIVDGKSLWIYQPEDKLAMVDRCFKQDTLTASLSFLWGGGNISKQFDTQFFDGQFGDATDIHLQLTPKIKSPFYKRLILVVDPKIHRVKQSIIVDLEGNINQFVFNDIKFGAKISPKEFSFVPPKGIHMSMIPGSAEKCK